MLIINADDWGRSAGATDNALRCYERGRITSASAMVFMADSARGSSLAKTAGIGVGLHLNLSEEFADQELPARLRASHRRISRFLRRSKYALVMYHPLLRKDFAAVFEAQLAEFRRLFGGEPTHFDGHQHMHLCSNVLLARLLPLGAKVRRSFSFEASEKSPVNLFYRRWVDGRLAGRHRLTDEFHALDSSLAGSKLPALLNAARSRQIELMCHPEIRREFNFLMGDEWAALIRDLPTGSFSQL